MRFIDLFAGLGGFHIALESLGHTCVFASEINEDLRLLYKINHGIDCAGDINVIEVANIPKHDVICAGLVATKEKSKISHDLHRIFQFR